MRKRRMAWASAAVALALIGVAPGGEAAQSARTPWLGVSTQEITGSLREGLDYRGSGVLVSRVVRDGPAERAGIRTGDVIASFNSRTVDSPSKLVDLVRSARVGQSVSVTVVRDGSRRNLTAKLAERPERIEDVSDAPAPREPRAPRAPRGFTFDWDGESFEMPEGAGTMILRSMGRGRLGVQIQDMNADLGEALGVTGGKGVLVTEVVEDSPASRAGIKAGDVITEVAGRGVEDVADLQRELRDKEGRVKVTVARRGVKRTVEPELEARPETRWRSDGDRRVIRIPEIRSRVLRDRLESDADRRDLEAQIRELRQELRELRRMMEDRRGN